MRRKISATVHPFFFASFFIFAFYATNVGKVKLGDVLRPLIITYVAVAILLVCLDYVLKNLCKAGLLTSAIVLLFFSYGHVFSFLAHAHLGSYGISRFLFPAWIIVGGLIIAGLGKHKGELWNSVKIVNSAAILLICMPAISIVFGFVTQPNTQLDRTLSEKLLKLKGTGTNSGLPDVYYILLDAYARDDVLAENFGYDNGFFLKNLKNKGFYVVPKSYSNYPYTILSVPSLLNMRYLDSPEETDLPLMIQHSEVSNVFKSFGYTLINFGSGNWHTDNIASADVNHNYHMFADSEKALIRSTLLEPYFDIFVLPHDKEINFFRTMDGLAEVPNMPGPKFAFAHITVTHKPYVFDRAGILAPPFKERWSDGLGRMAMYLDQIAFVNTRVQILIDCILARSTNPPIIIIQADHGPPDETDFLHKMSYDSAVQAILRGEHNPKLDAYWKTRMGIISAYYFPSDFGKAHLYDSISPVNTFRSIFDTYFGTQFGLVEDKHYANYTNGFVEVLSKR